MTEPTRGVDTPHALLMTGVRERRSGKGCGGGQHYMHRPAQGDTPWQCMWCGLEQPYSGGYATWAAAHAPVTGQAAP